MDAIKVVLDAIKTHKKIALYADYDVDGTMSCVSWIWFFREISFDNFVYHIPNRFTEGYGVNLKAIQKLVEKEKAELQNKTQMEVLRQMLPPERLQDAT